MSLARAFERHNVLGDDMPQVSLRPAHVPPRSASSSAPAAKSPSAPASTRSTSTTFGVPIKPSAPGACFTRLSLEEMAHRRLDDLCYNGLEKFSRGHLKQCFMKGFYFMEVDTTTDVDSTSSKEDITISMCALTGSRTSSTLKLATAVHGVLLDTLVDSGSTHSFVNAMVASRLGLSMEERPGLSVGITNGDRVPTIDVCMNAVLRVGDKELCINLYVFNLGSYDLVLRCEWL